MILALRQRHRWTFFALGALLPLALFVGIAARRTVPAVLTLPSELLPTTQTFTATESERADLFANSSIKVRLWRDLSNGQLAVGFTAAKDFLKPDLIAYWVAGRPVATNELPTNSVLLGSFVASPLALPTEAATTEGSLILFSLADQEVVDVSKPFEAANLSPQHSRRLTSAATGQ